MRLSLRTQLAVFLAIILTVMVVALSSVLGWMMARNIRADAGNALQVVATSTSRILSEGMHQRLAIVSGLARDPELWSKGLGDRQVTSALDQQVAARPSLAWLGVADTSGTVVASRGDILLGADVSGRPWFKEGLHKVHVGDVHAALLLAKLLPPGNDGEPQRFVDFAAPIVIAGRTRGVLGLHGSWDWAHTVIDSLKPVNADDTQLDVFIFDRSGTMIYAPPGVPLTEQAFGRKLIHIGSTLRVRPASVTRWEDGIDYLTTAAPMIAKDVEGDLGWFVVARMPTKIAFAAVSQATANVVLAGALMTLLAVIIAWYVAGTVSRPLRRIARAANELNWGNDEIVIPTDQSSEELEILTTSLQSMASRFKQANSELTAAVSQRTAELEAANKELERIARFDPLTNVLNRRGFAEYAQVAIAGSRRRGARVSVIAIDIDHFKAINDHFGHPVGDLVLQALTTLLKSKLRETDVLGRAGGEEFWIMLPDTDLAGARVVAESLVTLVKATDFPEIGEMTISAGVAMVPGDDESLLAFRRADKALYAAKKGGRNRAVVFDMMSAQDDARDAVAVAVPAAHGAVAA